MDSQRLADLREWAKRETGMGGQWMRELIVEIDRLNARERELEQDLEIMRGADKDNVSLAEDVRTLRQAMTPTSIALVMELERSRIVISLVKEWCVKREAHHAAALVANQNWDNMAAAEAHDVTARAMEGAGAEVAAAMKKLEE